MRIYDILSYLESKFPISSQASFDNCGLLVGDNQEEVRGTLICLDCTESVLEEAIATNCNLVIAHHPLIFKGLKKLTGKNYVERTILKAIKNNIAIYAIHTNLDHSIHGINAEIGRRLGLVNLQILDPQPNVLVKLVVFVPSSHIEQVRSCVFNAGGGNLGNYDSCSYASEGKGTFKPLENANPFEGEIGKLTEVDEVKLEFLVSSHKLNDVVDKMKLVHPYEEVAYDLIPIQNTNHQEGSGMIGELPDSIETIDFLRKVKDTFKCGIIRHTEIIQKEIKRVAYCGGSGSFLLEQAVRSKADVFITGDFKYHEFFDADNRILIADIGHFESEQFTSDLIYSILTEKFVNFAFYVTKVNTNPINYF
jgi:dinuclear metal center YbgI/SA1388 family protein